MLAALPHLSRDTTSGKDGDYHTWEHRVDLLIAAVEARCRDKRLLLAEPRLFNDDWKHVPLARTTVFQRLVLKILRTLLAGVTAESVGQVISAFRRPECQWS